MPILLKTVLSLAEACLRARLIIQPSNLRHKNPLTGAYEMHIVKSYIPKVVHIYAVYWLSIWGI
jgi:hypothetical protein